MNSLFHIHPHIGYLNSEYVLVNNLNVNLRIKDMNTGIEHNAPALGNLPIKLTAGEHTFVAITDRLHYSEAIKVFVEDAIKLGGSLNKKTYIFEDTPWVIRVMLDRTYFFNRDTKENYVEHKLSPNNVQFITKDYLLFTSEQDNSIFSLNNLCIITTFGDSTFEYSNDNYAIFSHDEGLTLYPLKKELGEVEIIRCSSFCLDRLKDMLYFNDGSKSVIARSLTPLIQADDESHKIQDEKIELPEKVRLCFGSHSVIYGNSPCKLFITNLRFSSSALLYDGEIPISKINDTPIWGEDFFSLIHGSEIRNAFTKKIELSVFERNPSWFYIKRKEEILKIDGVITNTIVNSLIYIDTCIDNFEAPICREQHEYLSSATKLTVVQGANFDYIYDEHFHGIIAGEREEEVYDPDRGETITLVHDTWNELYGKPIISPSGYILISKEKVNQRPYKGDNFNKVLENPVDPDFQPINYSDIEIEKIFETTGFVKKIEGGEILFYDCDSKKTFNKKTISKISHDLFIFSDNNSESLYSKKDKKFGILPCIKKHIVAISEQGNFFVTQTEKGISIVKQIKMLKDIGYPDPVIVCSFTPMGEMQFDNNFYSDALIEANGEYLFYKKDEKYYLRNIVTDIETTFELQDSLTRKAINGYLPYVCVDEHRRPVFVDPITLKRIDPSYVGGYTFQNNDGSIRHDRCITKYCMDGVFVSLERYNTIVKNLDSDDSEKDGYTFSVIPADLKRRREPFFKLNKKWLIEKIKQSDPFFRSNCRGQSEESYCFQQFMRYKKVCDSYVFTKRYFIREVSNGENIDIEIPQQLWFLNYVAYSSDNRYVIISGRFPENSHLKGLCLIYDLTERKEVYRSTNTMAVWLGVFNKQGSAAFYDSNPTTYILPSMNDTSPIKLSQKSFLAFSPSGTYAALSCQGYIPYSPENKNWGHQPSNEVYIVKSDKPFQELEHFQDHGDRIERSIHNKSVASAMFSQDEKRLMTVSNDGVIVIRNLHLNSGKN